MKTKTFFSMAIFTLMLVGRSEAQIMSDLLEPVNDADHPCISDEQYQLIEQEVRKNRAMLGLDKLTHEKMNLNGTLEWPLRPSANMTDCGYFYISAFVDQNVAAGQTLDFNCGNRTYDGHRGVDLVGWPFIWDKMDNDLIEVIAAAPGIITAKLDGNPDRVCNGIGGGGTSNNYITVEHADGSTALYVHMKTGSLTSKGIGDAVAVGEYLGIVGSAGQSTGPHLHFEIRSDGTFANYVDPFFGGCNSHITGTLWQNQVPYTSPELLRTSIHGSWPYMGVCPVTKDTLYEQNTFTIADVSAFFNVYTKHVLAGDVWNCSILNPDNSVFTSWNYTSLDNRNTSSLGWQKQLPNVPGVYTFMAEFNGSTCSKQFVVIDPSADLQSMDHSNFSIYPNPSDADATILFYEEAVDAELIIRDQLGKCIERYSGINGESFTIRGDQLKTGVYYLEILSKGQFAEVQKWIVTD